MTSYDFEWDPFKAIANRQKHGVPFEEATTVFLDPRALSVYDAEHGEREERWVMMGISSVGRLLVVCHTFRETGSAPVRRPDHLVPQGNQAGGNRVWPMTT